MVMSILYSSVTSLDHCLPSPVPFLAMGNTDLEGKHKIPFTGQFTFILKVVDREHLVAPLLFSESVLI